MSRTPCSPTIWLVPLAFAFALPVRAQGPQAVPIGAQPEPSRPSVALERPEGPVFITYGPDPLLDTSAYRIDFDALDVDGDGALTRAEVPIDSPLTDEFHVADSNQDGRLSREELKGWR